MSSKPNTMSAEQRLAYMQQSIDEGGSVPWKGNIITTKAGLPSLSDLAATTEERTQALADLEARRRSLDAEEARLKASLAGQPLGSRDNIVSTGISGEGAQSQGAQGETAQRAGTQATRSRTDEKPSK